MKELKSSSDVMWSLLKEELYFIFSVVEIKNNNKSNTDCLKVGVAGVNEFTNEQQTENTDTRVIRIERGNEFGTQSHFTGAEKRFI